MNTAHRILKPAPAGASLLLLPLCLAVSAWFSACCSTGTEDAGPPADLEEIRAIEDRRDLASSELTAFLANSDDAEVRARAAAAMGRIQSADYVPSLVVAAGEEEEKPVRLAALFALGQMGLAEGMEVPPTGADAAAAATAGEDSQVAAAAVEAVGKIAAPGAAAVLLAQADHEDPAVRAAAVHGLFRLRFAPVWRRQVEGPPALPDGAVRAVIAALEDPAAEVREMAAHLFSRYGDPRAIPTLAGALSDEQEWVRLFAVRGLGRSAGEAEGEDRSTAIRALLGALKDSSGRVRAEAVMALERLSAVSALPSEARAALAEDPFRHVRAALARALGGDGGPDGEASVAVLQALLEDIAPSVQGDALGSLVRLLGVRAVEPVAERLEAEHWPVRVASVRAAQHLGAVSGKPLVEKALEDQDRRVQAAALEVWGALEGDPRRLAAVLPVDDLAVRGTAVTELEGVRHGEKVAWLTAAYEASPGVDWVEVREGVSSALAQEVAAGEEAAVALLRRIAVEDDGASVRRRARSVLAAAGIEVAPGSDAADSIEPSAFLGGLLERSPDEAPVVVLETNKGNLVIQTNPEGAPIHVTNFIKLVEEGFYDGLVWHRVVPNFVIQGGDPQGTGWGGPGYALRDEIHPTPYRRGTVGMPKAGKDTGGCQIFITHVPTPHLDGNYTIFGQVVEGDEVIDQIEVGDRIVRAFLR